MQLVPLLLRRRSFCSCDGPSPSSKAKALRPTVAVACETGTTHRDQHRLQRAQHVVPVVGSHCVYTYAEAMVATCRRNLTALLSRGSQNLRRQKRLTTLISAPTGAFRWLLFLRNRSAQIPLPKITLDKGHAEQASRASLNVLLSDPSSAGSTHRQREG